MKSSGLLVCGVLALLAAPAFADRQTGSIRGTVTEAAGGRLRGVKVTLSGDTGSVSQDTGPGGDYLFPSVDPGRYDVKAELDGFQSRRAENVVISIARDVTLDLALSVAGAAVTVEVVEEAPDLLPRGSSVDNTLSQDLLFNMPFVREFDLLPIHTPGIDPFDEVGSEGRSVNHFGANTSAILLDGVAVRDPAAGVQALYLNYSWVQEVQVTGLGAPAEYGAYTGAVINSVTRSGGNRLSGLIDVLYGPPGLVSRNLSDDLVRENPALRKSTIRTRLFDISAQVGGPLVKDRLFFFAGVGRVLQEFEPPGGAAVQDRWVAPGLIAKLMYRPGPRDRFAFTLEHDNFYETGYGDSQRREITANDDAPETVWSGRFDHSFGPRTFGELKYMGWTGYNDLWPVTDAPRHLDTATGEVSGSYGFSQFQGRGRHQLNASLSHYAEAFGKHDLKLGLEIERSRASHRFEHPDGLYYYDNQGVPYLAYSYSYETVATNRRDAAYAQDSWRLGDRLTVNAGLRLDWIRGGNPERGKLYDVWNLQPRIGFSFDPTGSGRWILKAHWGRYHEAALTRIFHQALPGAEDYVGFEVAPDGSLAEILRFPPTLASVDPGIRHPRVDEWIAGTEGALPHGLRVAVTGIWRSNRDVIGNVRPGTRYVPVTFTNLLTNESTDTYVPQAGPGSPLITNPAGFRYLDADGAVVGTADPYFDYRALMFVCRRPFVGRWQAQLSYVLSKATGTVESDLSNVWYYTPGGRYRSSALLNEQGELTKSRRHEIKAMASYQVPKLEVVINAYFHAFSGNHYAPVQPVRVEDTNYAAFLEPKGARELPWQSLLDLRIEKVFGLGGGADRIGIYADVRNVFNAGTVTSVDRYVLPSDPGAFERPLAILEPRAILLGARWSF